MFDNSGKLYRNLTSRMDDSEDIYRLQKEYDATSGKDTSGPGFRKEEDYFTVSNRMKETYVAKNSDYGSSFDKTLDKYGIIGAIIRMQDKMNRIDGYYFNANEEKKVDESLIDTLEDLGNYAIMTSVWLRNQ